MAQSKVPLQFVRPFTLLAQILAPERSFYVLAVVYGIGISLLSLAVPISVQMLINTVANTGLTVPLVVLSLTLFGLLLASGVLSALRIHLIDVFARRFYARMVSEMAVRSISARNPFFADTGYGPLFNRYFDIVIVQKTVPYLFLSGFAVVLQAAVGFFVVSLYHPLFLIFNIACILLVWLVWIIWGQRAIRSGIDLSHKKHSTAAWVESLGASNGYYKSDRHVDFALDRTDRYTRIYIDQHKKHFRHHFSQTLCFLFIYAIASATLLGLGGWLVIQGELTLGQLVAAELILSATFFGISQLGGYLSAFYDLCAATEELSQFMAIPQEEPPKGYVTPPGNTELVLSNVTGMCRSGPVEFNLEIPAGSRVMGKASDAGIQRLFLRLLRRYVRPDSGLITLGGVEIGDMNMLELRREIIVLDRPTIVDTTIREYLELASGETGNPEILQILKDLDLSEPIAQFRDGLDTPLTNTGWPLSLSEMIRLKLASACLLKPRVLAVSQLIDAVGAEVMTKAEKYLPETTIIIFSKESTIAGYDNYLNLSAKEQTFGNGLSPTMITGSVS